MSTAVEQLPGNPSTTNNTDAAGPKRRTVGTKRVPSAAASVAATEANTNAVGTDNNDGGQVANAAATTTAKKPRAPRAPKAASTEPKEPKATKTPRAPKAAAAPKEPKAPKAAATAPKEPKAPKTPKTAATPRTRKAPASKATKVTNAAAAADDNVVIEDGEIVVDTADDEDAVDADEVDDDMDAQPAVTAPSTNGDVAAKTSVAKQRKQRTKPTYIRAFGDLLIKQEDRDFSRDAFEAWRKDTKYLVETITFTAWKQLKKGFYRDVNALGRHQKKKAKTQDVRKTSANHATRLQTQLTAADFEELNDKWLSQYGFDGSFTADQLLSGGCPNPGASSAFVVFEAAMHFGVRPRGIVSEKSKNSTATGELEFLEKVDGERVYVGISLPFRGKSKSKFSVEPNDRAYEAGDSAIATSASAQQAKAPKKRVAAATKDAGALKTLPAAVVGSNFDDEVDDGEVDIDADIEGSDDGNDDA